MQQKTQVVIICILAVILCLLLGLCALLENKEIERTQSSAITTTETENAPPLATESSEAYAATTGLSVTTPSASEPDLTEPTRAEEPATQPPATRPTSTAPTENDPPENTESERENEFPLA